MRGTETGPAGLHSTALFFRFDPSGRLSATLRKHRRVLFRLILSPANVPRFMWNPSPHVIVQPLEGRTPHLRWSRCRNCVDRLRFCLNGQCTRFSSSVKARMAIEMNTWCVFRPGGREGERCCLLGCHAYMSFRYTYRLQRCTSGIPGTVIETRLLDAQEGASTERYTPSESFRRDVSNVDVSCTVTIPTVWRYRAWKIGLGGVT